MPNGSGASHAEVVFYALVNKLGLLLADKVAVLRGVGDQVALGYDQDKLVFQVMAVLNEASKIYALLRANTGNELVKAVARELAYRIEDCVDLFITRIEQDGDNIQALQEAENAMISDMQATAAIMGSLSSALATPGQQHGGGVNTRSLTTTTLGPFGTEDHIAGLAKMVVAAEEPDTDKLKAFCVLGPKGPRTATTLVEVHRLLEKEFDCTANVSVTQEFAGASREVCELLKGVLQQVVEQEAEVLRGINYMEEDELVYTLQGYLEDKRYLILVDGVCTVAAWEAIRSKFSDNNRRSRIVMTTEMQTVAESCNPATAIYRLNLQSNSGYEWPAITTRSLTISGDNGNLQENVVGDIRRLAQTRLLVPTLDEIEYLYERRYHNLLPADVKECMRYLSIFPKGYGINKKRLIYRWIAEGLVPDVRQGQSLLALAESFLDKLVGKELVELGSISYWYTTCRVPDPMHKVILSDTINERYACLVGAMEGSTFYDDDRVRILSIHADDPEADLKLKGKNMRFLRSLSMFQPQDRHKLLDRLAEFTYLKMLDLERCTAVENRHVRLVCKLILLKFLSFKDTNITVIPDEIGELRKLQTLDVDDTLLTGLPETVTNLVMLERLHFSNKRAWDAVWRLPRGLKKMKALRAIYKAGLTDDVQVAQEIGELAQLQELGIILFNSGAVLQELAQALGKRWPNLQMLHTVDHSSGTKKLNLLLDVSSPPLLLQHTRIAGIIDRLPDWVKLLRQLTEISLSATELRSDQILGVLCTLPRLLTIGLWRNSYTDAELVARAEYRFPMLKELSVTSDYDEHKVLRFEQGSMPTLETLEYRFGNMDKRIVGVEHLTGLKKVTLIGNKGNPALSMTEEQLKSESNKRSARFEIKVAP